MLSMEKELKMGGQALIEGVMMRSGDNWAAAVRTPDGEIVVRRETFRSLSRRFRFLGLPVLRGMVILFESLILGVRALNYSAEVASQQFIEGPEAEAAAAEEEHGWLWKLSLAATVVLSLAAGMAIFFYLPLLVAELCGIESPFWFNAVDGLLRITVFLAYLLLISRWKEIRRVFEYHGAEHQTIAAFEKKQDLSWDNIRCESRFHTRCGTSFILVLLIVSVFVFMAMGKPADWSERFLRMLLIPVIGGVSYELIKLSDRYPGNLVTRLAVAPGLWLQRITTLPPDESQVEVAVAALEAATETGRAVIGQALAVSSAES